MADQPIIGEWKGKATITLNPSAPFKFSFGFDKAKLIVDNIEAIRQFVAAEEAKKAAKKE